MYCEKCNAIVVVIGVEINKTCTCNAPIIAEMEAVVIQKSSLE